MEKGHKGNAERNVYGIHWFRRDLRVAGNPALRWHFAQNGGRVVGIFFFDAKFLARSDFSHSRFAFFLATLRSLRKELRELGSDLLVVDRAPLAGWKALLNSFTEQGIPRPKQISWNRDYEPFARARDQKVAQLFEAENLPTQNFRDHLLIEPHEITRPDGGYYQVYSPFARRWFEKLASPEVQSRLAEQQEGLRYLAARANDKMTKALFSLRWSDLFGERLPFSDALEDFAAENDKHVSIKIPKAGSAYAYEALERFAPKIGAYKEARDFPGQAGTSQLSIFLKNGSLTSAQIVASLKLGNEYFKQKDGPTQYVKELAWREFYYHLLWHEPRVETEAFQQKYSNLRWENDEALFQAWIEGKTGYPIVDAGMRQLNTTGWMHNRLRMIVASFLVKDLLIDYRWGERYFMEKLLDGDVAPNNGGWQWAASTGCDPQPYFRIFNPILQGLKFDALGDYVRRFVPELSGIPGEAVHDLAVTSKVKGYLAPIVDHQQQKSKALAMFKSA